MIGEVQSQLGAVPSDARQAYPYWTPITTRWMDNDMYGHVNNVQYYSFFDTVVTRWLIEEAGVKPEADDSIGLCVKSQCDYHAPLSFPDDVLAGLRVGHIGRSSVRYEIAIYGGGLGEPTANGYFVHVYVDRRTRRPRPISDSFRHHLTGLLGPSAIEVPS